MPLVIGSTFAGYQINAELGRDRTGRHFLVDRPGEDRARVLSAVGSAGPGVNDRFFADARVASALDHPAVLRVEDYGITEDTCSVVTRHLAGTDLTEQRLTAAEITMIVTQIADALDHARGQGLDRGDFDATDIFVTRTASGALDSVALRGFGFTATEPTADSTAPASDQRTLATLAGQLIADETPWAAAATLDARDAATALRFPDCRAFASALGTALDGVEHPEADATPSPVGPPAIRPHKSKRGWAAIGAAIVGVLALVAALAFAFGFTATTDGSPAADPRPMPPALVTAASDTTCVVVTGLAYCSSLNGWGELGNGTTAQSGANILVRRLTGITAMSVTLDTVCAAARGEAYCWGMNWNGQVGTGSDDEGRIATPTKVLGLSDVTDVSAGLAGTCAVAGGSVYCWGDNQFGQLGDGTTTDRLTPTRVVGLDHATSVSINGNNGSAAACAVSDGRAHCWGDNAVGQLGNGTATGESNRPTLVPGLNNVTAISTNGITVCAVADAKAYCWGYNYDGQLGDGTAKRKFTPTLVPGLTDVTAISTGGVGLSGNTTCAIAGGTPYCWGTNNYGQLGDGTTVERRSPVPVKGVTRAGTITTSGENACAGTADGPFCWGLNHAGQLGVGTEDRNSPPTRVRYP